MTRGTLRTPFHVGLVGFGPAGSVFHGPLIDATEGLSLTGVVTANEERRALARTRRPAARLPAAAEALFALRPDLVAIATPNRTHAALAAAALEAACTSVAEERTMALPVGGGTGPRMGG